MWSCMTGRRCGVGLVGGVEGGDGRVDVGYGVSIVRSIGLKGGEMVVVCRHVGIDVGRNGGKQGV